MSLQSDDTFDWPPGTGVPAAAAGGCAAFEAKAGCPVAAIGGDSIDVLTGVILGVGATRGGACPALGSGAPKAAAICGWFALLGVMPFAAGSGRLLTVEDSADAGADADLSSIAGDGNGDDEDKVETPGMLTCIAGGLSGRVSGSAGAGAGST